MADRYWVSGFPEEFESINNWSLTSGGAPGASVPSTGDTAYFDANSGTYTVEIYSEVLCHIDVTEAPISFYFSIRSGGSLSLQEDLTGLYGLYIGGTGSLTTNNYNITLGCCAYFCEPAVVNLGTSTLTIGEGVNDENGLDIYDDVTLDADEATIILYTGSDGGLATDDGYVFGTVQIIVGGANNYLIGENTFSNLSITGEGKVTFSWLEEETQVILTSLVLEGVTPRGLVLSGHEGMIWSLVKANGVVTAINCSISDSAVSGGASFNASTGCVDNGNNTGWDFDPSSKYPIGGYNEGNTFALAPGDDQPPYEGTAVWDTERNQMNNTPISPTHSPGCGYFRRPLSPTRDPLTYENKNNKWLENKGEGPWEL